MAENLSYEELLSTLNGLKVRRVVQTEEGWVVEAEGSPSAICPDCGVMSHFRHSRCRELPLLSTSCLVVGVAAGASACARSLPTASRASCYRIHSTLSVAFVEKPTLVTNCCPSALSSDQDTERDRARQSWR